MRVRVETLKTKLTFLDVDLRLTLFNYCEKMNWISAIIPCQSIFPSAFFILGGVCVSFGGASYIGSLFALRRMMLLSVPAFLLQSVVVGSVALFWLCAVSLYIGRLEVEIIHEDEEEDEEECRECRERREHRGYRGSQDSRHNNTDDGDSKGSNK